MNVLKNFENFNSLNIFKENYVWWYLVLSQYHFINVSVCSEGHLIFSKLLQNILWSGFALD